MGEHDEPAPGRGSREPLRFKDRQVGWALRTRDGVSPVFVSPGHRMDFDGAARIVLAAGNGYRLPEPTRRAHRLVREMRRKAGR